MSQPETSSSRQSITFESFDSRGGREVTLTVGQRFAFSKGDEWEIETFKPEERIYSPSIGGGTPTVTCRYVGNLPISTISTLYEVDDEGRGDFCADSIELAISIQQREATKNPPTS